MTVCFHSIHSTCTLPAANPSPSIHRGDTSAVHPTTPATTPAQYQEASKPSDDTTQSSSQNRTPRLKVHVYKLEHLADSSVPSASSTSRSEASTGGARRLPNEEDLCKKQLSGSELRGLSEEKFSSNSSEFQSRVSGIELQTDPTPDKPARKSWIIPSQTAVVETREQQEGDHSSNNTPQHSVNTSDPVPDFTMECAHGYNRLQVGVSTGVTTGVPPAKRRGSGQYDKLATRDPLEVGVKVQTFGALPEQDGVPEISGRGLDGDKGRAYFIGGRGRESELETSGGFRDNQSGHENTSPDHHTLKGKLQDLSSVLQQHIQVIAEREKSNLQSMELEIHMGEVKVQ